MIEDPNQYVYIKDLLKPCASIMEDPNQYIYMGDLLKPCVSINMFFTFIGCSIAAFAFMCQYLNFPRALLRDLYDVRLISRTILDRKDDDNAKSAKKIVVFFREIDMVGFHTMGFIIYSIFMALGCAGIHAKIIIATENWSKVFGWATICYWAFRLLVLDTSYIIGVVRKDEFKYFLSLAFLCLVEGISGVGAIFFAYRLFWSMDPHGLKFFFSLPAILGAHFIAYWVVIAYRNPVSRLFSLLHNASPPIDTSKAPASSSGGT